LNVDGNKLCALPESIKELKELKTLKLGTIYTGNHFVKFPEMICQLTHFQKLEMNYCQLKNIPSTIAALKALRV